MSKRDLVAKEDALLADCLRLAKERSSYATTAAAILTRRLKAADEANEKKARARRARATAEEMPQDMTERERLDWALRGYLEEAATSTNGAARVAARRSANEVLDKMTALERQSERGPEDMSPDEWVQYLRGFFESLAPDDLELAVQVYCRKQGLKVVHSGGVLRLVANS